MKNKYLIFDFDWTLGNSTKEIFPWVEEMLKKLVAEKFTLFISSGAWDEALREYCKTWWIYKYFEAIMWSSVIEKSAKHIETFDMCMDDKMFHQKAIMIWDSDSDWAIAEEYWINFIKIWKTWNHRYEVDSVLEVEELVKKVK